MSIADRYNKEDYTKALVFIEKLPFPLKQIAKLGYYGLMSMRPDDYRIKSEKDREQKELELIKRIVKR